MFEEMHYTAPNGCEYLLTFEDDNNPSPPWDDDGAVPVVWRNYDSGYRSVSTDGARGYDLTRGAFDRLTDRQIKANLAALVDLCDGHEAGAYWFTDAASFDEFARAEKPGLTLRQARRETLAEWLDLDATGRDALDKAAAIWAMQGVPAEVFTSRGYSQGDVIEVLAVAHPDAVASWGFRSMAAYRKACPNDLQAAAHLLGALMWGGVIGYRVNRLDDDWEAEPDDVDSCWGFYPKGSSDAFPLEEVHSYAVSQAKAAADADSLRWRDSVATLQAAAIAASRPDLAGALA